MERDLHRLLREVSSTPAWTADEKRRVREHVAELIESVNTLEAASEDMQIFHPGKFPSSASSSASAASAASEQQPQRLRSQKASSEMLVRHISDVESCLEHLHEHVERSTIKTWGPIMARGHWSALVKDKNVRSRLQ